MNRRNVFHTLAPILAEAIPKAAASGKQSEPLCRLCVYYYDTHAPYTYLRLVPATEKWRAEVLSKHGDRTTEYFWSPGRDEGDLPDFFS